MLKEPIIPVFNVERIMSIFYFEFATGFDSGGESHDFWELVYVDKGEITVRADDKSIVISQGQVVFHKPNEFHKIAANDIVAPNVFIISFVCTSAAMEYFENKVLDIPQKLRKIISMIIDETHKTCYVPLLANQMRQDEFYKHAPVGSMQMIKLYLEQLLIQLLRDGDESVRPPVKENLEESDSKLMREVLQYLESHIYQEFSVNELCRHFNYSATYLSKIFRQTTGRTILDYYTDLKMVEARRMIRENNLNITQIAHRLGYESPQYFSRAFKRINGMKPMEYKRSVYK